MPTLADASDPLGKLQRGLGAGYLWALDADRTVAHALLMHCVFNDPRWDRQLDDRDDYHATLALDLQLHTGALELWLRDSDEDIPDTTYDVLGMLGRMAVRGHADARRVLREYVGYGRYWQRAIDQLIGEYDGAAVGDAVARGRRRPRRGARRALRERRRARRGARRPRSAGAPVDDVVRREPAHRAGVRARAEGGAGGVPPRRGASSSKRRSPRERTMPARTRPREMSTAELLQIAEDSRWTQIADELARAPAPEDVRQLLGAANDPGVPMRRAAILALGRQGRRELLEIAEQHTKGERNKLQGAIALALEAMPLSQTRALAHDWLTSPDWARRRKAAGMLATWSEDEDLAPARRALERELDAGLEGDVYVICSLAAGARAQRRARPVRGAAAGLRADPLLLRPALHRRGARRVGPDVRRRRRRRVPVGLRGRDAPAGGDRTSTAGCGSRRNAWRSWPPTRRRPPRCARRRRRACAA